MLEQTSGTNDKYQLSQQQLIERLMQQLIRQKSISSSLLMNDSGTKNVGTKQDILENAQQANEAYEKSNNDLNRILEMELVSMKQKL